jgi:glycosyltransferase involved in cell wall biosynthesis
VVGISLLALVPGEVGGSEIYTRELLRALGSVGQAEYLVLAPPVAPEAGEGLPTIVAPEYRRAHTIPQRLLAMASAAARPAPLRAHLHDAEVVHYPLTLQIPPVEQPTAVTLHDVQHLDLPDLFGRAERAFRTVAWHRSVKRADLVIVPSAFVRDRAIVRVGLEPHSIRVVHSGVDHTRFKPANVPRERFLL